ncbi:hypothetical protein HXX79_02710 [Acetobacter tropicalis]|nr:hypothetical protein [Acetobacter tropicalis]
MAGNEAILRKDIFMGYDVTITREAFMWPDAGRPLLQLTQDMVYAVVATDPSLAYEAERNKDGVEIEGQGTIIYVGHPDREIVERGENTLWYYPGTISAKYPDDHLIKKMAEIGAKLKCFVVGDNAEAYFIDDKGELVTDDTGEKFKYIVGDTGKRYEIDGEGRFVNLNQIPDYLAENRHSFTPEDQARFITSAPPSQESPKIYGLGITRCEEFAQMHEQKKMDGVYYYYTWYQGFISGLNVVSGAYKKKALNYATSNQVLDEDITFLYAYSKANPKMSFLSACEALLRMRNARHSS